MEQDLLARLCERETALGDRCWLLEVDDSTDHEGRLAADFAARLQAPIAVVGKVPFDELG